MTEKQTHEEYTKLSIHPLADQIAAWWILRIKRRHRQHKPLPAGAELAMTLYVIEHQIGAVRDSSPDNENVMIFDPSPVFKVPGFASVRREIICDCEIDESDVDCYFNVASKTLSSKKLIAKFSSEIRSLAECFQSGLFQPIGWDKRGRLEILVKNGGDCRVSGETDEVFVSMIGVARGDW
jgi:hypothetical protein